MLLFKGYLKGFIYHIYTCFYFKVIEMKIRALAWTEELSSNFDSWEEKSMFNLQKNVWFVLRSMFLVNEYSHIGCTKLCHYKPESKRQVHKMEIYWLSGKEIVPSAVVNEEVHAYCLLGHEMWYHYWLKVSNSRQGWSECSLFNSYYTVV